MRNELGLMFRRMRYFIQRFNRYCSLLIAHCSFLVLLFLAGCAELDTPTATPIVPTVTPPPPPVPLPTTTALPPAPTLLPPEDTPTPLVPTVTLRATPTNGATPTPTFLPNPPALARLLQDSYARMAALPGYTFTATLEINNFNQIVRTQITGAYARPNRLRWTTSVDGSITSAVIVGDAYFVSLDRATWTAVPNPAAALNQYRLWSTLAHAAAAEVGTRDDPTAPLAQVGYSVDPAYLPLPRPPEPWRLTSVGAWIGRADSLLYRLDLAAQTANYLLEEHIYFSDFDTIPPIDLPAVDTAPPADTP